MVHKRLVFFSCIPFNCHLIVYFQIYLFLMFLVFFIFCQSAENRSPVKRSNPSVSETPGDVVEKKTRTVSKDEHVSETGTVILDSGNHISSHHEAPTSVTDDGEFSVPRMFVFSISTV